MILSCGNVGVCKSREYNVADGFGRMTENRRRGSGEEMVASRETSGRKATMICALEARTEVSAHLQCAN